MSNSPARHNRNVPQFQPPPRVPNLESSSDEELDNDKPIILPIGQHTSFKIKRARDYTYANTRVKVFLNNYFVAEVTLSTTLRELIENVRIYDVNAIPDDLNTRRLYEYRFIYDYTKEKDECLLTASFKVRRNPEQNPQEPHGRLSNLVIKINAKVVDDPTFKDKILGDLIPKSYENATLLKILLYKQGEERIN